MRAFLKPYKIVGIYAALSALWILFSDRAASILFSGSESALLMVNTLKGWFYVAVISWLLMILLKKFETHTFVQARLLNEREQRLRLLVENAGDAIYMARLDGFFVEVNTEASRQTGYSREELLTMSVADLDQNQTKESFLTFAETLRRQQRMAFESVHRRKNGEAFPVELRVAYLKTDSGEFIFGIARDITERKRSENALHQNSTLLASILNTVSQSIFWKDMKSVYQGCNMAFAKNAGLESPELIKGKTDYDLPWLAEESTAYREDDRAVMESGQPKTHIIEQQLQANGKRLWLDTSKFPMRDQHGVVQGVLGIYEDITERKQAGEALRESEEKYRRLHESIMDAYVLFDMDGRIREHNNAFSAMVGYSPSELAQMTNTQVTPPQWQEAEARILADQVLPRGYSDLYEKQYMRKDGTAVPVELRTYLLRGKDGRPSGLWSIARDVTERKRLQEAMVQSEKMMSVGGLAAGMAHEINNPLGGILQSAQVLASRLRDDLPANLDQAREAGCDFQGMSRYFERRGIFDLLTAIRECATRAAKIVADMLEFSRKSNSGYLPEDLNAVVDKAVELATNDYDLKNKYDFKSLTIVKEYDPALPPVKCSATEIEQVVLNLLKNAAHALSRKNVTVGRPKIILRTRHAPGKASIIVEDNGPGMEPDVAKRVFEPFYTTKEAGQGTGLGLSVSYFIVSSHHGGEIRLDTKPGEGSVFTVELPIQE